MMRGCQDCKPVHIWGEKRIDYKEDIRKVKDIGGLRPTGIAKPRIFVWASRSIGMSPSPLLMDHYIM
jgi:hypothetical protein